MYGKCIKDKKKFFHTVDHLNRDLTLINESLSLKCTMENNNVLQKERDKIIEKMNVTMKQAFYRAFVKKTMNKGFCAYNPTRNKPRITNEDVNFGKEQVNES